MLFGLLRSSDEAERTQGASRSGKWPPLEHRLILAHPFCSCCGTIDVKTLEGHHIVAFHACPEWELWEKNVVILCGYKLNSCHRLIGHGGNFREINPKVLTDIEYLAAMYRRIRQA